MHPRRGLVVHFQTVVLQGLATGVASGSECYYGKQQAVCSSNSSRTWYYGSMCKKLNFIALHYFRKEIIHTALHTASVRSI